VNDEFSNERLEKALDEVIAATEMIYQDISVHLVSCVLSRHGKDFGAECMATRLSVLYLVRMSIGFGKRKMDTFTS